ncbi:MAG: hypothetical protein HZC44_06675 [Geobacter sp.]|nr:hypothetical protein [Geobacter sp.]
MSLPALISNNLDLKIVSVVMASLFWLYVTASREAETRVQVPLHLVNLADGLACADKVPNHLDLDVKGSRFALMALRPDTLQVALDMNGVGEGSVAFTNLEQAVRMGSGIRITRVYPGRIELVVVRKPLSGGQAHKERKEVGR